MDDPKFSDDLKEKLKRGEPPVHPLPKNLLRKRAPKFTKRAFRRSLILHGSIAGLFLLSSLAGLVINRGDKQKEIERQNRMAKMAIRVDIVDLPSMKLEQMKSIDLSQKVGAAKKVELPPPPPPPSPTAMKQATKKPMDLFEKESKGDASKRLKALQEQMRADAKRKELAAKLKGGKAETEGREALRGNKLSEGASLSGEIATQADAYNGKLQGHLNRHWRLPDWSVNSGLSARVLVKIGPDGRIASKSFVKRSANEKFNESVERALEDAEPFPAPPPALSKIYLEDGIEWGFPK
jgi:TonB family protein